MIGALLRRTGWVGAVLALGVLALGSPAVADPYEGSGGGGSGGGTTGQPSSSAPQQEQIRDCTVYASGTGMGSYCLGGSGAGRTLRERYGGDEFVSCRYENPPEWMETPENPDDSGRFLLKQCIEDINWNTFSGGSLMHLSLSIEWVPNDADLTVPNSNLMRFLWDRATSARGMPVPLMRPQPSTVPVVGYPTFFTFTWIAPETEAPVGQGPYEGNPNGGPYREVANSRGLRMIAEATEIVIDPHQTDMEPITCTPDQLVYEPGVPVAEQPDGCRITFTRSSAAAAAFADEDAPALPSVYRSAYPVTVTVRWRVTYGFGGAPMVELGDGFEMTATQALPVQEVQAPNEPPIVLY